MIDTFDFEQIYRYFSVKIYISYLGFQLEKYTIPCDL